MFCSERRGSITDWCAGDGNFSITHFCAQHLPHHLCPGALAAEISAPHAASRAVFFLKTEKNPNKPNRNQSSNAFCCVDTQHWVTSVAFLEVQFKSGLLTSGFPFLPFFPLCSTLLGRSCQHSSAPSSDQTLRELSINYPSGWIFLLGDSFPLRSFVLTWLTPSLYTKNHNFTYSSVVWEYEREGFFPHSVVID